MSNTSPAPTTDAHVALFIYNYDPVSDKTRMDKFVSLGNIEIANQTLARLRATLISEKVLSFGQ